MATVYEIRNLVCGKVYIGSTIQQAEKRKQQHWSALRGGYHHNQHLQRSWNLYRENAFRFTPIVTIDCSEAEIRGIETQYIRRTRAALGCENVYTVLEGAENPAT